MIGLLIYKYEPFWQDSDTQVTVKVCGPLVLYSIQNKVDKPYNFHLKYPDQVIISIICIWYFLKGERQPNCVLLSVSGET